jgi:hypothetical protein
MAESHAWTLRMAGRESVPGLEATTTEGPCMRYGANGTTAAIAKTGAESLIGPADLPGYRESY